MQTEPPDSPRVDPTVNDSKLSELIKREVPRCPHCGKYLPTKTAEAAHSSFCTVADSCDESAFHNDSHGESVSRSGSRNESREEQPTGDTPTNDD